MMSQVAEYRIPGGRGFEMDRSEPLLLWARARILPKLREVEKKGERYVGAAHLTQEERSWMLAEYLVWRLTPEVWRPRTFPTTEIQFAGRWDMTVQSLMWYRRAVGFEKALKEGLKFGISSVERILDVKNQAHSIVMEQKKLAPKERDARWLSELAKMEGLSKNEPLVTINNVQNTLNAGSIKTLAEAEAVIQDVTGYFTERGVKGGPVRAPELPAGKGQEALGRGRQRAVVGEHEGP